MSVIDKKIEELRKQQAAIEKEIKELEEGRFKVNILYFEKARYGADNSGDLYYTIKMDTHLTRRPGLREIIREDSLEDTVKRLRQLATSATQMADDLEADKGKIAEIAELPEYPKQGHLTKSVPKQGPVPRQEWDLDDLFK